MTDITRKFVVDLIQEIIEGVLSLVVVVDQVDKVPSGTNVLQKFVGWRAKFVQTCPLLPEFKSFILPGHKSTTFNHSWLDDFLTWKNTPGDSIRRV